MDVCVYQFSDFYMPIFLYVSLLHMFHVGKYILKKREMYSLFGCYLNWSLRIKCDTNLFHQMVYECVYFTH